ncbi:MAG TPA: hypothetical protein PLG20_06465, partial [Candidatus Syntrophosphaera sp.]|nr:hypothetical protein [Candidatus Syntrophosphaera sp.]
SWAKARPAAANSIREIMYFFNWMLHCVFADNITGSEPFRNCLGATPLATSSLALGVTLFVKNN